MEFANVAEFRQNASKVFDRVQRSGEVVVLRNGRPIGLLVAADVETIDPLRVATQRTRTQLAVERLRKSARARGLEDLTSEEIDALVRKTRKTRRRRG
jgi:antitoxin (DNA-binding transcriptional repressor) of toxin-antitoxin stability system